jgi:ribosomal protein S18 acetylase RimI-like enzyme
MWSVLANRHRHLSQGGPLARRYRAEYSPIAGLPAGEGANVAALRELVPVGDDVGTAGPFELVLPSGWETLHAFAIAQMVRTAPEPLPEAPADVVALGPRDVAEMIALVELTRPGPFRERTIELGRYVGIREGGRLVAMAGERMWIGNCREVSAVCTHPVAQGRGYARALVARVVNRMLRAGEMPFLHVDAANVGAIALYGRLGFARRAAFPLVHARRVA